MSFSLSRREWKGQGQPARDEAWCRELRHKDGPKLGRTASDSERSGCPRDDARYSGVVPAMRWSCLSDLEGGDNRPMIRGHRLTGLTSVVDAGIEDRQVARRFRIEDVIDAAVLGGAVGVQARELRRLSLVRCIGPRIAIVLVELGNRTLVGPGVHVAG